MRRILFERRAWRNASQLAAFELIVDMIARVPVEIGDGFGPGAEITTQAVMRYASCQRREAEICLRDLIESGICDRPDPRAEVSISGIYRPRPDRWATVEPYGVRSKRRKANHVPCSPLLANPQEDQR